MTDLDILATRYVWWKTPAESQNNRRWFIARLMNLATDEDMKIVRQYFTDDDFRAALAGAVAGEFSPARWMRWHLEFGLDVPRLPLRKFGDGPDDVVVAAPSLPRNGQ
jgi:hypothetical protein